LEETKRFLPQGSVIEPRTSDHRGLLASWQGGGLATASQVTLRLVRAAYFWCLFNGRELPTIDLSVDRFFPTEGRKDIKFGLFDFQAFLDHWRNPGFKFSDLEPYWVKEEDLPSIIPLRECFMGLDKTNKLRPPNKDRLREQFTEVPHFLGDPRNLDEFLRLIDGKAQQLPYWMLERIPLLMESDNYVKIVVRRLVGWKPIFLISMDRKLGDEVVRISGTRVYLVHPLLYLVGRLDDVESFLDIKNYHLVVDPGAILFHDLTHWRDGSPITEDAERVLEFGPLKEAERRAYRAPLVIF